MNNVKIAPLLLIFVEVAKLGSFTQAGKKLNLSKSAVSQQIKRLEDELKTQLIARNSRGLTLTTAGELLLNKGSLISEQLANTLQDLNTEKAQPSGVFRVSIPPFLERDILVPALRQFCLEYPLLRPEVLVTGQWQDLIENNLDAAIFGGRLKDSEYKALSVGKVKEVFCCTPNYLEQHGGLEDLEQIQRQWFIATPWQKHRLKLYRQNSSSEVELTVEHQLFTNSLSTLVDMTSADMGLALIPEFIAHHAFRRGQLVRVLPEYHGQDWHFFFLHRYKSTKPSHVDRFYTLIKHFFNVVNEHNH